MQLAVLLATASAVVAAVAAAPTLKSYDWQGMNGGNCIGAYSEAQAGHTWYTNLFPWFDEGYPIDLGLGTGSAWFRRAGHSQPGQSTGNGQKDLDPSNQCACSSFGGGCRNGDNMSCGIYFESIEGGPGYWSSGSGLPTSAMKWRIGVSTGCYQAYTGSPMFQFGQYSGHVCSPDHAQGGVPVAKEGGGMPMGFITLSNRMVVFPDGVSLSTYGLLGVGYLRTPFGKVNSTDTRNYWTVVLDSSTFSGPLGYFLPAFWKLRDRDLANATRDFPDFGDVKASNVTCGAVEIDVAPALNISSAFRLPKVAMPIVNGRAVMFMGQRGYTNDDIFDPLERALEMGTLDSATILAAGKPPDCHVGIRNATYFGGPDGGAHWPAQSYGAQFGKHVRTEEDGDCVWAITHTNASCKGNMTCEMPRFINAATKPMTPMAEAEVPASLRAAKFPRTPPTGPYDVLSTPSLHGDCRDSPGPASGTLYCVQSTSPSWIAFRWYRFVDQPGLQQLNLSVAEANFIQKRVETLHKMIQTPMAGWIKPRGAAKEGLAATDIASIVTPPTGMEAGFVPIALYEGLQKPAGCDVKPVHAQRTGEPAGGAHRRGAPSELGAELPRAAMKTDDAANPFAYCGAGEAGIMGELRDESDSPFGFGTNQWCCGNTTWSSFAWRAKATRNVDFSLVPAAAATLGGRSNASECIKHSTTAVDCFSFCFNVSNGGGCRPLKGPTGPPATGCQAVLDAVCNAPSNAKCINATVNEFGGVALPLVGVYDTRDIESHTESRPRPFSAWRCYAQNALDPTHNHWNGNVADGYCNSTVGGTDAASKLAAAFASASSCKSVQPGAVAYPADTWTDWRNFSPDDLITSRANKKLTTTVGAYYCGAYPNEYLDPIQHLVLNLRVSGIYFGNSSNITLEIRPRTPSGASYQLTAMVAPISGAHGANAGTSNQLTQLPQGQTTLLQVPFMVARENLTTASSHLGPQVRASDGGPVRPVVTEREHNSLIWSTLPKNKKTPKKIVVCQGYHGANDVEGWLDASRALVGFGATAMTGTASVALKQIFDAAGVGAARIGGGLGPPKNSMSHLLESSCKDETRLNGHCWGHSEAEVDANLKLWAETTILPLRTVGFTKFTQFALHDELGWTYPSVWGGGANISGNPRVFQRFQEYIKTHSGLATPQAFGAQRWAGVVPITFDNVTKGAANEQALRVRVYWSVRYAAYDVVTFYGKATAALIAANAGQEFSIYTNCNNFHGRLYTPASAPRTQPGTGVVTPQQAHGGMDWFEAGRYRAGTMIWTEDW
jgi:hypothetical protein